MKFNLDIPRMGYFILYKHNGDMFGKAIEKRQILAGIAPENACFTHIEVSGGGEYSVNISPPVSKLIKITEHHKGRYKVAYFSAAVCANKPYDVGGILNFISFLAKWFKQNNRLYFCSEGCATVLQMVYPQALGILPDKVMPAHFLNSNEFEICWEGIID